MILSQMILTIPTTEFAIFSTSKFQIPTVALFDPKEEWEH